MPRKANNKPQGLFAEIAKIKKSEDSLIGDIQTFLLKKAQNSDRRQDIIHPSELAKDDVCGRAIAYRISGVEGLPKKPNSAQMELIFQEGHSIHHKYQEMLEEMGVLYGSWRCKSCDLRIDQEVSANLPEIAKDRHRHVWEYREVPIDAEEELLIHGHEDGAIGKSLIEVKSIGLGTLRMEEPELIKSHTVKTEDGKSIVDVDGLWKSLRRPLKSHRRQAGLYLYILKKIRGEDWEDIIFLYENKANQQVKEFRVKLDEELVQPLIDLASKIKYAVEHDEVLPRPDWAMRDASTCKSCPFIERCYGEDSLIPEKLGIEESHSEDGSSKSRGQEAARASRNPDPESSSVRGSRASRGNHRSVRPAAHDVDGSVGGVGRVVKRSGQRG